MGVCFPLGSGRRVETSLGAPAKVGSRQMNAARPGSNARLRLDRRPYGRLKVE